MAAPTGQIQAPSPALTGHEQKVLAQLRRWHKRTPGLLAQGFAQATGPVVRLVQVLVPEQVVQSALHGASAAAARFAMADGILERADADSIAELRATPLDECDALVEKVQRQAVGMAVGGGVVTGAAGLPGLAVDVPALLTLSLHTIHRTGLCYGYDMLGSEERAFAIGVFALASANSMAEKRVALRALHETFADENVAAWRDGLERAAQRELSKEAAVFSVQNLARQLGVNLTRRKMAVALPVIGAVIGGAVNAWYMRDLGLTARYVFQGRRLIEKGVALLSPA
jgi:hypothetical protein